MHVCFGKPFVKYQYYYLVQHVSIVANNPLRSFMWIKPTVVINNLCKHNVVN